MMTADSIYHGDQLYKQNIDFVSLLYRPFFFYIKTPYSILIKEHFNFIKTYKTSLKTVIVDVFLSIKRHLHFFSSLF